MDAFTITGLQTRPDALYHVQRAQAERDRLWASAVDHRAANPTAQSCPSCGGSEYDTEVNPPYCPMCGYSGYPRNSNPVVAQRSSRPCPGCQVPTSSGRLCGWCQKWQTIEARALARYGTLSEHQISQLGSDGW